MVSCTAAEKGKGESCKCRKHSLCTIITLYSHNAQAADTHQAATGTGDNGALLSATDTAARRDSVEMRELNASSVSAYSLNESAMAYAPSELHSENERFHDDQHQGDYEHPRNYPGNQNEPSLTEPTPTHLPP